MTQTDRSQGKRIAWTYSMNLHQMPPAHELTETPPDVFTLPIVDTITGTVEADCHRNAVTLAWHAVMREIKPRRTAYGLGDLHVMEVEE